MPEIVLAKNAGFCFGVRRATDTVERMLAERRGEGQYTCILGKLIHNPGYNAFLAERGAIIIDEQQIDKYYALAMDGADVCIIIRTHGIVRSIEEKLKQYAAACSRFTYCDCTCPYVKKIHRIASEHAGDRDGFVLIGAPDHPEVQSIMSYAGVHSVVCENAEQLEACLLAKKEEFDTCETVYMAAQTTQKLSEWKKCQKIIKKVYTNSKIFDTICGVTENRQTEAEQISLAVDGMIVIGGRDSSNTGKLFEVAKKHCVGTTVWVEDVSELTPSVFSQCGKIGITAGASTPDRIIEEVKKTMTEQENFAQLLESSMKTLNTGDTVVGVVTYVSNNEIHLDLGAKATGVITYDQITDDPAAKLTEMFKLGDEVEAFVIKVSDLDGLATLSKKRVDADKNRDKILATVDSGEILEGKVIEAVRGGVIVSVDSVHVFVPASMTGVPKDGDLHSIVGTIQKIKVIEVKGNRAYGSIRAVQREERKAKEAAFWAEIEEGKVYEGPIKSLTSYGAFVDLGGVDGMVHVSELSWKRIKNPAEVVKVGDTIRVFVKAVDKEAKRISLGYKTEEMDPWFIFNNQYQIGDVASVKIVSIMPFGAFAEIVDGVDGLIHISQIADRKLGTPAEVLEVGQTVDAKIVDINNETKKVSLSIRALLETEEVEVEIVEEAADAE